MGVAEKRQYQRVNFQDLPWVFLLQLDKSPPTDFAPRFEPKNMSRGGLKFLGNIKFPLFATLSFQLVEKKTGNELASLSGKVVRVEEVDTGKGEKIYGIALEIELGAASLPQLLRT